MPNIFLIATIYLAVVNVVTFGLYAYDKHCAKNNLWRVRESTLLIWTAIGGGIGALFAMQILRHKTQHLKFNFLVPFLLFLQIFLIALFVVNPDNIVGKFFSRFL
ncbi:MAG: DUF1294 domain-containing protein [Selenomonadaceae bacterium]|nr:DUF1294 domain-containing protein [Selenomonadaceae bacterium]